MPSTHFETTIGAARVVVDEPLLSKCDMHGWPFATAALALVALVILCLKPSRWHFLGGGLAALAAPFAVLVAWVFVPTPRGDDGSVFGVFPEIKLPADQIYWTVAFATLALAFGVTALVAKKDGRLRIAASLIIPLAIGPCVRSVMCARAFRAAIDDLTNVHEVATIDASDWPKGVHVGQPFAIHNVLTPAVPKGGILWGIGARRVEPGEWRMLAAYTATEPHDVDVLLTADRGPVHVEVKKRLVVWRDEGPSWLPLELGNTWTLTNVRGKPEKKGAVDAAFTKDAPDPKGTQKVLRVERETFGDGLHEFVLTLTDVDGAKTEATVYRRDGELVAAKTGDAYLAGDFPLLGKCRYAIKPIDDARTLAGPTICGFTTLREHYGGYGAAATFLQIISLGAIDARPTHEIEEAFILVRSGGVAPARAP